MGDYFQCGRQVISMLSIPDLASMFYDTRKKSDNLLKTFGKVNSDFHFMRFVLEVYQEWRKKTEFCIMNNLDGNVLDLATVSEAAAREG